MNGIGSHVRDGAITGVAVLVAALLLLFAIHLREILAVIALGIVVGLSLAPTTDLLARFHIPRAISVLLVYGLLALLLAGFLWYAVPALTEEANELIDRSDEFEQRYAEAAEDYNLPPLDDLADYVRDAASGVAPNVARQAFVFATVLVNVVTILVVAVFFNTVKDSARQTFLSLVSATHRERAGEVLDVLSHRLRRFVYGELISMVIIGVITYIGLLILGVPFALVLAVLAFALELIPLLGPWISVIPAVGIALTEGPELAIAVAVFYLVVQQIESNVVLPLVQRSQVEMPALLILIAVLLGGATMGILGVLVSLPAAVVIHTLAVEVIIPWRQRRVDTLDTQTEGEEESQASAEPARPATEVRKEPT